MSRQRGFTLLELLVATVIMATAVAGLLSALSTSTRNAAKLTDYDRAAMLATRKMDEMLVRSRLPRHVVLEGPYSPAEVGGTRMGWRARIAPFDLPSNPGPGQYILDRIEVQIWWDQGGRERSYTVEGFRRSLLTQEEVANGALAPSP